MIVNNVGLKEIGAKDLAKKICQKKVKNFFLMKLAHTECWSAKIVGPNEILIKNNVGPKQIFVKKMFVQKHVDKRMLVQKMLCQKNAGTKTCG